MHPDLLQAAAAQRIERYQREARGSALRRALRAARARRRGGQEPGGGLPRAIPEHPPSAPRTAMIGDTAAPAGNGTAAPQQPAAHAAEAAIARTAQADPAVGDRIPAGR